MAMSKILAGVAVAGAALTLTACGGNPITDAVNGAVENAVENQVENIIENQTGVDMEFDSSGGTIDMPSGFPSGIPVPSSGLFHSMEAEGSFILTFKVPGDFDFDALVEEARSSGFENLEGMTGITDVGELRAWIGDNGTWNASYSFSPDGDAALVQLMAFPSK